MSVFINKDVEKSRNICKKESLNVCSDYENLTYVFGKTIIGENKEIKRPQATVNKCS